MRLFIILFSALYISLYISYAGAACPAVTWQETVTLKKINDGDTVTLSDGRLVRFIGINTPEINHRERHKSEPFAIDAKILLEKYINKGDKLHLVFDKQRQDKYGRLLAYVYSKTGRNLALLQLQAGLAEQWVVAGNDRFWSCFQGAENQARAAKKGIWSSFTPLSATDLKKSY
ncbi:thermonuclease family protein [Psychromonas sp. MME2]|uniref:thermonuclease family protein n=1 Tax=Psychromonas sp. MME2 TaxID=3231033 RepID=UPI00339BA693